MRRQAHNPLWEAAKLWLHPEGAGQVVLCYHADDLISEAPGLTRQHLRMEMNDPLGGHIVAGCRLLSHMLVEL